MDRDSLLPAFLAIAIFLGTFMTGMRFGEHVADRTDDIKTDDIKQGHPIVIENEVYRCKKEKLSDERKTSNSNNSGNEYRRLVYYCQYGGKPGG